jgi:hypothetical protein
MQNILRAAGWACEIVNKGLQNKNDGNSCGYHVLHWLYQLASVQGNIPNSWENAEYSAKIWAQRICERMGIRFGIRRNEQNKKCIKKYSYKDNLGKYYDEVESQLDKKPTPNMPPTKQEITDDTYNGRFCEASQAKSHEWVKNLGNKLGNSKAKIQPLKQRTSRILNRPTAGKMGQGNDKCGSIK